MATNQKQIKPLAEKHLQAVWEIEQVVHSSPWAQSMINDVSSRGACHHVLLDDSEVVGYFYAQNIVGEVTLLNIAVAPKKQGKGIGKELIEHFLLICTQAGAESVWLEVRESNSKARYLYERFGFNEIDRRINYYPTKKGKEDAIIMACFL